MRRRILGLLGVLVMAVGGATVVGSPAQAQAHIVGPIKNDHNGSCLDVATQNNVTVQLWNCTGKPEQNWIYGDPTVVDGGSYLQIVNWHTSTCLDVAGSSLDAGVPVQVRLCGNSDSQLWQPLFAGSSKVRALVNKHSGLCLDLFDNHSGNGTIIQQWPCSTPGTNAAQVWREDSGW